MDITAISDTLLDETSSGAELHEALNAFAQLCSEISGVHPDPSFDAWAEDSLLPSGVAINPQAAAHCVTDYQRSVIYIRGIYAAIRALRSRFPDGPLEVLYAGCGPFATLLLPLLGKFSPGELNICLLDIHQQSLDSVKCLLAHFGFGAHAVSTVRGDACRYRHPVAPHLVIAETMQKALEQEPQVAVTVNLAPQLRPGGIFIPQCIEVALELADLEYERDGLRQSPAPEQKSALNSPRRYPLATVCSLSAERIGAQLSGADHPGEGAAKFELPPTRMVLPELDDIARYEAALFTRITVFEEYRLGDYDSEITLPLKCHELVPLIGGAHCRVSYQLGSYPRFHVEVLEVE